MKKHSSGLQPDFIPLLLLNSGNFMNGKCQAFQSLMNPVRGSGEFILEQECEASADRQTGPLNALYPPDNLTHDNIRVPKEERSYTRELFTVF